MNQSDIDRTEPGALKDFAQSALFFGMEHGAWSKDPEVRGQKSEDGRKFLIWHCEIVLRAGFQFRN